MSRRNAEDSFRQAANELPRAPRERRLGPRLNLRLRRWFQSLSLLSAAGLTIMGLFLFAGFAWFIVGFATIGGFTWEITSSGINRSLATQIALTMVGGAGAAVALVVTYRRHSRLEEGSFLERLGAAAAQLGDDKPAVQFAGVYALAALADESKVARRQQVVDVLCGYLRLPYDPTISGRAGVQTHAEKTTYKVSEDGVQRETTVTTGHKSGEREVRATIFRTIRDHLQPNVVNSWSDLDFDFTGSVIDDCDLTQSRFLGNVTFDRAQFRGTCSFRDAEFSSEGVTFFRAQFSGGNVGFQASKFSSGSVWFSDTEFAGAEVDFSAAEFSGGFVHFDRAEFSAGEVLFRVAAFSGGHVSYDGAAFSGGDVSFEGAAFSGGDVSFRGAAFSGTRVSFSYASFLRGLVSFKNVSFSGGLFLLHWGIEFSGGEVSFESPRAWDKPPRVPWKDGEEPPPYVHPRHWPPKPDGQGGSGGGVMARTQV